MTTPHSGDAFSDRRRGLEEAFFKDRDQKLLDKLKGELEHLEETRKLAHVSGIVEEHVLKKLVEAGVRAETLVAVALIPQVEVAWCDGSVSLEERDAVLNAAVAQGIAADSAAYGLLLEWLTHRPDSRIVAAWREYVQELARLMPPESFAAMKSRMIDRCTRVAEAAGGFLGLATISRVERAAIEEFAKIG